MDEAVQLCLPTAVGTNNKCLFTLARAVKTLELVTGKFTSAQLTAVFDQWHVKAGPFLDPNQTKEDYLMEFLHGYDYAKYPLGSSVVPLAFERAKASPPPEAEQFQTLDLKLLVGLCRQLQIITSPEPFYLSSRMCQKLFKQASHTTAAKWLSSLVALQILERTERGNAVRATRYRYKGKL